MDTLVEKVRAAVQAYAGKDYNGYSYYTESPDATVFAVLTVGLMPNDKRVASANLFVRLAGDQIIIERDMNSKILLDDLLAAGTPRDQIILAYAGESIPTP